MLVIALAACGNDNDCMLPDLPSKSSCDGPDDQMGRNALELMLVYIAEENLQAERTATNLYYVIEDPGSGDRPSANANVTVDYVGYHRNDCRFDAGSNASFNLSGLIPGWREGIRLVGRCGRVKLIVPPSLGYGNNPPEGIVGGEPLIFDINLLDFEE